MINLRSDNEVGAHAKIIEAVSRAFSSGSAFSYGADEWTQRVERRLREIFEKPELVAHPVLTGTAANSLALSCVTPPWGAIFAHPTGWANCFTGSMTIPSTSWPSFSREWSSSLMWANATMFLCGWDK